MLLQNGELDCQIELGAHARAGTLGGFLDHTITSKAWFSHKVNGMEMSELSLHALLCAQYAVPVIACIGDEAYENAPENVERVNARTLRKTIPRLSYYEDLKF